MNLTQTRFLWLHEPAAAMGHLHEIASLGFQGIAVKILEGRSAFQPNTTRALIAAAASMGLAVIPWMYARPGEAQASARAVEALLPKGCTDLIVDMEAEFESQSGSQTGASGAAEAEALLHAIAQATGHHVSLHLSSYWSPDLHPAFPFAAALRHCASWMPQVYLEPGSGRRAGEILDGTLAQAKAIIRAGQPLIPTINDRAFLPLLKAKGITGYSVYAWDADGDAQVSVCKQAWQDALSV